MKQIEGALKKGIGFLNSIQTKNGNFLSYSSAKIDDFSSARPCQTSFTPALMLGALAPLSSKQAQSIKTKLASYLLKQKSNNWTFNYWQRNSPEAKRLPYPDDLDDTFCALMALDSYNPQLIDGKTMSAVVKVLLHCEQKTGGPYKTWVVPQSAKRAWQDVDLAVNFNVAAFLDTQKISLSSIEKMAGKAIQQKSFVSRYYPSEYPLFYFLSRFYKGERLINFKKQILSRQKPDGSFGNPLFSALAVLALFNVGAENKRLQKSINYLLKTQGKDGSWPAYAFCLDPAVDGQKQFAGSSALSTAFALEALAKYQKPKPKQSFALDNKLFDAVILYVKSRAGSLDKELRTVFLAALEKITAMSIGRTIVLLPALFYESLGKKYPKINQDLLVRLGAANLYGWIAYTIYDDFLDEEGDPQLLSAANVALKELTLEFYTLLPSVPHFWPAAKKILDEIDAANTWETATCRFKIKKGRTEINSIPNYGNLNRLSQRSFGHALGPLAILFALGFKENSQEIKYLSSFFRHYLIARQLNDDMHDWQADLARGQINAVCAALLKKQKPKTGETLSQLTKRLQKYFWEKTIKDISKDVLRHCSSARRELKNLKIIRYPEIMLKMLEPIEKTAEISLTEHAKTTEFIKHYRNN